MPALWICGDSNSGGVANALAPLVAQHRPTWAVVNQAVGAETSLDGCARVRAQLEATTPTVAVLCWGGADALHEYGRVCPEQAALTNMPAGDPALSRPAAAARQIELARAINAAGGVAIFARGVGCYRHPPLPSRQARWGLFSAAEQAAWIHLAGWLSVAYRQVAQAMTAEDVRTLTDADGARSGYHIDEAAPGFWSDGLHLTRNGYEALACRVVAYLDREGLW